MQLDLSGKTAIVTGSGRGIGAVIATTFAEAGADIVAAARTESEIEATVETVEEYGVDGLAVPTDVREVDDLDHLMEVTVEAFGTPEILVNNAGENLPNPPLEQTIEEVDTMLETNLRGLYLLSQRFARTFRDSEKDDGGRIVNISSIQGQVGFPSMSLYSGTKAGIYGINRSLAVDFGQYGITVNSVSPGPTRIQRVQDLFDEYGDELFNFDQLPLGRVVEPEEVADACLFLASDMARTITGTDILLDAGISATTGFYR